MTNVKFPLSFSQFQSSFSQVPPDVSSLGLRVQAVWSEELDAVAHWWFVKLKLPGPSSPIPRAFSTSSLKVVVVRTSMPEIAAHLCYGGLIFSYPYLSVAAVIAVSVCQAGRAFVYLRLPALAFHSAVSDIAAS